MAIIDKLAANGRNTMDPQGLSELKKLITVKKLTFDGRQIEVSIPKGALADYMFVHGKASNA